MKKVDNRLRKYYKLTEAGIKEKVHKINELEQFIENIQGIINPKFSI